MSRCNYRRGNVHVQCRRPSRQGGGREPRKGARGALRGRAGATGKAPDRQSLARRPCPRKAAITTCRSRLACLPPWASLPPDFVQRYVVLGELSLDGSITAVAGVLPAAIAANGRGSRPHLPQGLRRRKRPGPARMSISWRPANLIQTHQPCEGQQSCRAPSPAIAEDTPRSCPTSRTSRARRRQSARSRSPPPAAIIC